LSRILVTGGSGFIGSALVRQLLKAGKQVRVFDNNFRGSHRRLADFARDVEFIQGDIRDAESIADAANGVDEVHHLAFVNGTSYFYEVPELVLDVGVRGMINVIDACRRRNVPTLILASSSEVYQSALKVPTDESAVLTIPDPLNPRYSYAAGKLISEVMAINFGRKFFERVLIFRPHNAYGPDMGFEHVIPEFAVRLKDLAATHREGPLPFKIQGTGEETRSFCFVDDLIAGIMIMREKGEHLGIYHVGTMEEVKIADLARRMGRLAGHEVELIFGTPAAGGTTRRCPDISKLTQLGYKPRVSLDDGLKLTVEWYWANQAAERGVSPDFSRG
jgi:nucleoside-diphosphate-sugar epimerase